MGRRRLLLFAALLLGFATSSLAEESPLDEFLGEDFNASEFSRPGHLSPELDWKFELPPHIRRRGISHAGSMMGMRRLVRRCINKQPITFGVVGGSISTGHGMAEECHGPLYNNSYSRLVYEWLDAACPHPENAYLNGALAATGTMHFSQCLWQSVPKNLDVILIEFTVNEGGNPNTAGSMELIVRRLLMHNPAITIVIVNWHDHWPQGEDNTPIENWRHEVRGHAEEGFTHIGVWYDTVVISARTAFLPEMLAGAPGASSRKPGHPHIPRLPQMSPVGHGVCPPLPGLARADGGLQPPPLKAVPRLARNLQAL